MSLLTCSFFSYSLRGCRRRDGGTKLTRCCIRRGDAARKFDVLADASVHGSDEVCRKSAQRVMEKRLVRRYLVRVRRNTFSFYFPSGAERISFGSASDA